MSIVEKAMRKRGGGGGGGGSDRPGDQAASSSQEANEVGDAGPEAPVDPVADNLERAMLRFREAAGVDGDAAPGAADLRDGGTIGSGAIDAASDAESEEDGTDLAGAASLSEENTDFDAAEIPADEATSTIAAAAAADRGQRERRARASEEIELDLTVEQLRSTGLWPAESETRRIEDQYRRIKRPLLANAFGINTERLQDGNLIMVASSLPGEGKSFTSFNLAASIANELDRTVLLVDADVAKPHITRSLGLHERRGLIDLLLQPEMDLQDVILRTSMNGMRILPAGPIHKHATELLASERMATLVRELADRYPDRVIVFDTPPLLLTTEAQAMAHLMGQIVVVVHAAHTPQSAVMEALESLEGSTSISLVLNKTRTASGEEYSRYGYYYY